MEITYITIVAITTYILGAFTKLKWDSMPDKFIPLQNVIIGVLSGIACYLAKLELDLLKSIILCITASCGAGGLYDLIKTLKTTGGE